jgi:hypothetical protein
MRIKDKIITKDLPLSYIGPEMKTKFTFLVVFFVLFNIFVRFKLVSGLFEVSDVHVIYIYICKPVSVIYSIVTYLRT